MLDRPLELFKRLVDERSVLEECKRANVILVFERGGKEIAQNYRPLSRTSTVCKTLRKTLPETN